MKINVNFEISIVSLNNKKLEYDRDDLSTLIIHDLHEAFDGVDDCTVATCLVKEIKINENDN